MADRAKCVATTVKGNPCKSWALEGAEVCSSHSCVGHNVTLNGEVAEQILVILRDGNYVEVACRAAGVGRSTFYAWLKRGDPAGDDPAEQVFRDFAGEVEKARAEGEARNVELIARAAEKDWKAAAWLLERQHPGRWGPLAQRPKSEENPDADGRPADPFEEVDELAARRVA